MTLSQGESERGLIHGPDTNPLSPEKKEKNGLLGGGLNWPLWFRFKTFSDAFLPAANVNKGAPVGKENETGSRMGLPSTLTDVCPLWGHRFWHLQVRLEDVTMS